MTVRVIAADYPGHLVCARNSPLTCVIKTNPGEYFSAITMISTMISLDAYESLTP